LPLAACGGGSAAPALPAAQPARTFSLSGFRADTPIEAGTPVHVGFTIAQPDGSPLTSYARGSGPHTGVHLLFVRDDLSAIVHHHPPIAADGSIDDTVSFPEPGRYRMVVDAYPKLAQASLTNFQLFRWVTVTGKAKTAPLPAYAASQVVDGYRVTIAGTPRLKAVSAAFLTIEVTDRHGRPAHFTPWYGALAHAIFFRQGSLDYFHTHVCSPGASGCTSALGGASVTGTSDTPGRLRVGVLVPVSGTWRLFLQTKVAGHVITAPFTLTVG